MAKSIIDTEKINNLRNSVLECYKDLGDMLRVDLEDPPEDLLGCLSRYKRSSQVLHEYITLKEVMFSLMDNYEKLSEIMDDNLYKDVE